MANSRTAVFRQRVRDHMGAAPLVVSPATPVEAVLAGMRTANASAAAVVGADSSIQGILTEQDVLRRVAGQPDGARPIEQVMTAPVLSVREDDHLFEAIGFMRRHRLRHMPVADPQGRLSGMLQLHEALAVAAGPLSEEIDHLTHASTFEGLQRVKAAQAGLARDLLEEGVPAPEVLSLIAYVNNDIYRRVLRLLTVELEAEGRGRAPVAFDCIVMGSGGRGESYLFPDQDNGFVLADYPDEAHDEVDAWFIELAQRMIDHLHGLGFERCRGGVMATNPVWRKTLPQWREQVGLWTRRKHEAMLLLCDIFFDFAPVFGEGRLAGELRVSVGELAASNRAFLREMFAAQADHSAGIGMFGRFVTERAAAAHRGEINLKLRGTLPLAEAVRLMALMHRVPATGTLDRIEALRAMGAMQPDEADYLKGAFAFLTGLQLRRQIEDFAAGRKVGNFVEPARLALRERESLRGFLRAINDFRTRLRSELTGQLIG